MAKRLPSIKMTVAGKGDHVSFDAFLKAGQDALAMLVGLEEQLTGKHDGTIKWEVVEASLNSPLTIGIGATTDSFIDVREKVIDTYLTGLDRLNKRRVAPRHFSEPILKRAQSLANLAGDGAGKIAFKSPGKPTVVPTAQMAANVESILKKIHGHQIDTDFDAPQITYGSVEGTVTTLKAANQDHLILKDRRYGREVRCYLPDNLEHEARDAWKRRIRAFGKIQYTTNREPEVIWIQAIRILHDTSELPQFKDFGIDITGGVESSAYVRELRDV